MSKRPYWLDGPCPVWCWGNHRKNDAGSDRRHSSRWSQQVRLSLEDPDRHEVRGEYLGYTPARLEVYVLQGYREASPRVTVEGGPPGSGRNFDLTLKEARKLVRALLEAVAIAEGQTSGYVEGAS